MAFPGPSGEPDLARRGGVTLHRMLSRRDRKVLLGDPVLRHPLGLGRRLIGRASESVRTEGDEHRVSM
jgi:hypothetical protein